MSQRRHLKVQLLLHMTISFHIFKISVLSIQYTNTNIVPMVRRTTKGPLDADE